MKRLLISIFLIGSFISANAAVQIQWRRDTAANWTSNDPTMAQGETGWEYDTGKFKTGDGSTSWTSLPYWSGGSSVYPATSTASFPFGLGVSTITFNDGTILTSTSGLTVPLTPWASDINASSFGLVDVATITFADGTLMTSTSTFGGGGASWPLISPDSSVSFDTNVGTAAYINSDGSALFAAGASTIDALGNFYANSVDTSSGTINQLITSTITFPDATTLTTNQKTMTWYIKVVDEAATVSNSTWLRYITVPSDFNGWNLIEAEGVCYTSNSGYNSQFNIYSIANGQYMLSNPIQIDAYTYNSYVSGSRSSINSSYATVYTGNQLRIDATSFDPNGMAGLDVILTFQSPLP